MGRNLWETRRAGTFSAVRLCWRLRQRWLCLRRSHRYLQHPWIPMSRRLQQRRSTVVSFIWLISIPKNFKNLLWQCRWFLWSGTGHPGSWHLFRWNDRLWSLRWKWKSSFIRGCSKENFRYDCRSAGTWFLLQGSHRDKCRPADHSPGCHQRWRRTEGSKPDHKPGSDHWSQWKARRFVHLQRCQLRGSVQELWHLLFRGQRSEDHLSENKKLLRSVLCHSQLCGWIQSQDGRYVENLLCKW